MRDLRRFAVIRTRLPDAETATSPAIARSFHVGTTDPKLTPNRRFPRVRIALTLLAAAVILTSSNGPTDFDSRLTAVAATRGFNLVTWEIRTLTTRIGEAVLHPTRDDQIDRVQEYLRLTTAADRARQDRDAAWAREAVEGSSGQSEKAQARVVALESRLNDLRPSVESTLSAQIENELQRQAIRTALITFQGTTSPPFARPTLMPGVFFQLGTLPDLLVVAPTNRIQIIDSVLVQPGLSPTQIDQLETNADGLGVSSVVTGIGGLAAYPSMLPDTGSVRDLLVTVSHEWTHHYLALHPLGMSYFKSYEMREINETVADMVGHEVGQAVYDRTYAPLVAPRPPTTTPTGQAPPTRPDFWTLMRETRVTVEGYLSRNDVAGANAYMAEQRKELARQGYFVRKLNTAYLSFFGSYSGGANPYERKLRLIRSHSASLADFLATVSDMSNPSDLDRALAS